MQNILSDGVVAVSACKSGGCSLLFFVDGQNETAKNILQILESLLTFLNENKFLVLSAPYNSVLHSHFEVIYGPTEKNSITFVANKGAAFLRWTGTGNLEEVIKTVVKLYSKSVTGEFGYPPWTPSSSFIRRLVKGRHSKKKARPSDRGEHKSAENASSDKTPTVKKRLTHPRDKTVLQIRSPDGLSMMETFENKCLLSEVRNMIASHFSLTERFGLATSFPRYHFVSQDYNRNLEELNLWPNAVLMIVPPAPGDFDGNTSLRSYTGSIFSWAYTIMTYMWNRVRSIFSFDDGDSSQATTINIVRPPENQPRPSAPRRQGNIHTLRDRKKDDDKRKTTYNGNSTQQL